MKDNVLTSGYYNYYCCSEPNQIKCSASKSHFFTTSSLNALLHIKSVKNVAQSLFHSFFWLVMCDFTE